VTDVPSVQDKSSDSEESDDSGEEHNRVEGGERGRNGGRDADQIQNQHTVCIIRTLKCMKKMRRRMVVGLILILVSELAFVFILFF
jgi:hypothetical protein